MRIRNTLLYVRILKITDGSLIVPKEIGGIEKKKYCLKPKNNKNVWFPWQTAIQFPQEHEKKKIKELF